MRWRGRVGGPGGDGAFRPGLHRLAAPASTAVGFTWVKDRALDEASGEARWPSRYPVTEFLALRTFDARHGTRTGPGSGCDTCRGRTRSCSEVARARASAARNRCSGEATLSARAGRVAACAGWQSAGSRLVVWARAVDLSTTPDPTEVPDWPRRPSRRRSSGGTCGSTSSRMNR